MDTQRPLPIASSSEIGGSPFTEELTRSLPEFIYVIDAAETTVLFRNRDFIHQLGFPADVDSTGLLALCDLIHPDDMAGCEDHRRNTLASRSNEISESTCRIRTAKGEWRWFQVRTSVFRRDEWDQPTQLLRSLQDVTAQVIGEIDLREKLRQLRLAQVELSERQEQLQQLNHQLAALATTDGLTGLYNYRAFNEKLAEETRRAQRHGHSLSVVLADIDDFKAFNDRFGHPAGDERLRYFSRVLKDSSRVSDFIARYGGEEFAMILVNTTAARAGAFAKGIVQRLNLEEGAKKITASFGCVELEPGDTSKDDLISRADACLYSAKHQGKNRVVVSHREPDLLGLSS